MIVAVQPAGPPKRVGKYEVLRKLGQGGFGEIYVARDSELDRELAIKFLRPEHVLKPHVVQRFLQEARAAARINHPGIVTVYECGQVTDGEARDHGSVFIAMELLDGETLANKLARRELSIAGALELVRQLAGALAAAHAAGIVHRDLKPQNVFLVADPAIVGGERVKILDFGIAKLVDGFGSNVQTHSMEMLGTPMYMSPEQCKSSAKVDARSDIYALGCILFEMVTGRPPFLGDSGELIAKHQLVAPPSARELTASTPPAIDRLLADMLAKSPDERPQAMTDVIAALDDYRDGRDRVVTTGMRVAHGFVETDPTTVNDRPVRRVPRRATLLAGAGAAVLAGIGIAVATTHGGGAAVAVVSPADAAQLVIADAPVIVATTPDAAAITVDAAAVDDVACDAKATAEGGTNAEALGEHAKAVVAFEASLACKPDRHIEQLAFMAACNARDLAHARTHWVAMTEDAQNRVVSMCIRNGIDRKQLDAAATDPKQLRSECLIAANERKWRALAKCAGDFVLVDMAAATRFGKQARDESKAEATAAKLTELLKGGDLKGARKQLERIPDGSVYHADALAAYTKAETAIADDYKARALKLAHAGRCKDVDVLAAQATNALGPKVGEIVRAQRCDLLAPAGHPPAASCNADELREAGTNSEAMGAHAHALEQFEQALVCKSDPHTIQLAFMAACNAHNTSKAKLWWTKMTADARQRVVALCKRNGISEATLDAP